MNAIYSTNTNRTRKTAEPLATTLGLAITPYDDSDVNRFAHDVLKEYIGQSVFIVGHSPKVPQIVDALGGDGKECKGDLD